MYLRAITVAMTLFSFILDGSFEPRNAKQSDAPWEKHAKSPENPGPGTLQKISGMGNSSQKFAEQCCDSVK